MITGIITFLLIVAVIGSILYGRRLIKSERVDAVFGNPERAKGGTHWVIVGTCFLMLSWLYYGQFNNRCTWNKGRKCRR